MEGREVSGSPVQLRWANSSAKGLEVSRKFWLHTAVEILMPITVRVFEHLVHDMSYGTKKYPMVGLCDIYMMRHRSPKVEIPPHFCLCEFVG